MLFGQVLLARCMELDENVALKCMKDRTHFVKELNLRENCKAHTVNADMYQDGKWDRDARTGRMCFGIGTTYANGRPI